MSNQILKRLRVDLRANADEKSIANYQHYFKETVKFYGLSMSAANKIANNYWKEIKSLSKQEIFSLCEDLYRSDYSEEAAVASEWAPKLTGLFAPVDLALFKKWIDSYLNDWAKCDGFCNHTVGNFVQKYPESIKEIVSWTTSSNRWMKRAAAVSLIIPAKKGLFLKEIFTISDRLLTDKDDMVQKGYGWMLKEASQMHQDEVYQYVLKHRKDMPRTALRYAIEKMPPELKSEAMKKIA
jgi:3-methyladenine DNA glycosylase AlkD